MLPISSRCRSIELSSRFHSKTCGWCVPAIAQVVQDDVVPEGSPSDPLWSKVRKEYMKQSTANLMSDLMSIGLKSLEDIDRETENAGGDAEQAAEKALAAVRAMANPSLP